MINAYTWLFTLGAFSALFWLWWSGHTSKQLQSTLPAIVRVDAGLFALVVGILGARLGYVLMHIHFYARYPGEILKIWNGGLTWVGGALGVIVGLGVYATMTRHPFWHLADIMSLPALYLTFILWFGCMLDGCAYGKPSNYGFLTPPLKDSFGTRTNRWPVQSTGAIFSLFAVVIHDQIQRKKPPEGVIASISLAMISAGNLLLTFFRGDPVPILFGLRADAVGSSMLFVLSIFSIFYCTRRARKT